MKIRGLLFIAIAIAAVSLILVADTPILEGGRIEGIVVDPSGAGISKAFILVHWDPAGSSVGLRNNVGIRQDLAAHTDVNGRFSISLPPGFYDVLFSASAFSPKAKKIRILPGATVEYDAQLQLDTGVSDALADKFK